MVEGTDDETRIVPEGAVALEVFAGDGGAVVPLLVGMGWLMVAVVSDEEAAPFAEAGPGRNPQPTSIRIARMSEMTIVCDQNLFTASASSV